MTRHALDEQLADAFAELRRRLRAAGARVGGCAGDLRGFAVHTDEAGARRLEAGLRPIFPVTLRIAPATADELERWPDCTHVARGAPWSEPGLEARLRPNRPARTSEGLDKWHREHGERSLPGSGGIRRAPMRRGS